MSWVHPAWVERERIRFMRHDADRYMRPDAERWLPTAHKQSSIAIESSESESDLLEHRLALARLRLDWVLLKLTIKAQKAGFDPEQPRDDRGRWTDGFGLVAAGAPKISGGRPPDSRDRTSAYREIARWVGDHGPAILNTIARTSWLYPAIPTIWSYLDAPKGLDELQQDLSTKAGYDVHHIVEQASAESDGFPRKRIDGPDNLVRIPKMKHWEINAWYQTRNLDFGGVTPRDYLLGKDWDERRRVGLEALTKFGVLRR